MRGPTRPTALGRALLVPQEPSPILLIPNIKLVFFAELRKLGRDRRAVFLFQLHLAVFELHELRLDAERARLRGPFAKSRRDGR